jgi:uncharacterized protein
VRQAQIDLKNQRLTELCRCYRVRRLALFGSALREDFDPAHSDLDFVVEFEALPVGAYADAYFGLLESLQDLFGRRVDLIVSSAIRNPYFRESVERSQAVLYAA